VDSISNNQEDCDVWAQDKILW